MQPSGVEQLTEELGALMAHVFSAAEGQAFHLAADLELSLTQLRALFILNCEPQLALHELADRTNLSMATIGRAVDALARQGLLDRREDEHDRRIKRASLSASGEQMVQEFRESRRQGVRALAAELDEHERAALSQALAPILTRFGRDIGCAERHEGEQ